MGDAASINTIKRTRAKVSNAPYSSMPVGKNAAAIGIEAGYDIFSQIAKLRHLGQQFYVFGRYEYYNSYIPSGDQQQYEFTKKSRMALGINYHPIRQIAVKAEYSKRYLNTQYNNEPSINIGIAYEGFFL